MKYFYSRTVDIEAIVVELDTIGLSQKEKEDLANLIDANIHNQVLDLVLSELKDEEKQIFLEHLNNERHKEVWKLLNKKDNIDAKIKKISEQIKKEFIDDIKEAKKIK